MLGGTKVKLPVRVGFLASAFAKWTGGTNYLRNLLIAIQSIDDLKIQPFLFINCSVDKGFVEMMKPYVTVIQFGGFFHHGWFVLVRGEEKHRWVKKQIFFHKIKRLNIQIMSHCDMYDDTFPFSTINWIPDFQHLHLPEMFSESACHSRSKKFKDVIIGSDAIVFSSQDAICDANQLLPGYLDKFHKLSFVAVPENDSGSKGQLSQLEEKYGFKGKYFYLPNQFWKHKNHEVVFRAIKHLKDNKDDVLLLCTGAISDHRNEDHIATLKNYIEKHDLVENILLLGLIPYDDVFVLFRSALAVINPSLFEGWSSTVEEAKSLGKKLIISDLPVHKEQSPAGGIFFPRNDHCKLAEIMGFCWKSIETKLVVTLEKNAQMQLDGRVKEYGMNYQSIVLKVLAESH